MRDGGVTMILFAAAHKRGAGALRKRERTFGVYIETRIHTGRDKGA